MAKNPAGGRGVDQGARSSGTPPLTSGVREAFAAHGGNPPQQAGARNDKPTRLGALLLSGLLSTPDSALDTFRERPVLAAGIDRERLRRARDLLDGLHRALTEGDAGAAWIDRAWGAVCGETAGTAPRPAGEVGAVPRTAAATPEVSLLSPMLRGPMPASAGRVVPPATAPSPSRSHERTVDAAPTPSPAPLPFVPDDGSAAKRAAAARRHPEPKVRSAKGFSETTDAVPTGATPLPFREPSKERGAGRPLTLQQFAALVAEVEATPERTKVFERYGISDDASYAELGLAWEKRFSADPQLRAEWRATVERFRTWLVRYR